MHHEIENLLRRELSSVESELRRTRATIATHERELEIRRGQLPDLEAQERELKALLPEKEDIENNPKECNE